MPDVPAVEGLRWSWIAVALVAPPLVGLLLAFPLWLKGQTILGSVAGAVVIFGAGVGLILREYAELDRLTQQCLDAGFVCWPEPSAFTRFALYAFIALLEVIGMFSLSLVVDTRIRRRDYAPEWR